MRSISPSTSLRVASLALALLVGCHVMTANAYITDTRSKKVEPPSDMPEPITAPTPAPGYVDWTKALEKPKTRQGTWDVSLAAGAGASTRERQKSPIHAEVAAEYWTTPGFAVGFFLRGDQAKTTDIVDFSTTGYREEREYAVTAYSLGLRFRTGLTQQLSMFFGLGRSMTETELVTVKTTAPVPSTLRPGFKGDASANTAYHAGFGYDMKLGSTAVGTEVGYSSTSDRDEVAIQEIFGSLVLRF